MSFGDVSVLMEPVGHARIARSASMRVSDPGSGWRTTALAPLTGLNTLGHIHMHVAQSMHEASTKMSPGTFSRRRSFECDPPRARADTSAPRRVPPLRDGSERGARLPAGMTHGITSSASGE
jgi:hypothetical protein